VPSSGAGRHRAEEPWRAGHFIACVDDLKGFPEAIEMVYPKAYVQLCIVHMVRNSLNFVFGRRARKCPPI
jgi:transposase-like protein